MTTAASNATPATETQSAVVIERAAPGSESEAYRQGFECGRSPTGQAENPHKHRMSKKRKAIFPHHAKSTRRAYDYWIARHERSGKSTAVFLGALPAPSRRQANFALAHLGKDVDLDTLPPPPAMKQVPVPTHSVALKLIKAVRGKEGDVLREIYITGNSLAAVLRQPRFSAIGAMSVHRKLQLTRLRLFLRGTYSTRSIRAAGLRGVPKVPSPI